MGGTDGPVEEGEHSQRCATSPADRARNSLPEMYYQPLLQLAALLTGDAVVAEAVVGDAFAAIPSAALASLSAADCLRYLQRLVIIRCRRAARFRRQTMPRGRHAVSDFARLPVVAALRGLPRTAREAVVLTHYLDLPVAQAAALAGVSEALLTANLATAMRAIDDHLIGLSPDS
ncbi:MAG TPA: sigma factor-like helix-turn-helix DNA-binding protein [Streptosporangiaceae bacterium]|nr:sigma factor-like helix-turn-helix DNA-binding protein [Streptosporangiaceae bacterium]